MKIKLLILFSLLTCILQAQNFDPTEADSVLYVKIGDTYTVFVTQKINLPAGDTLIYFAEDNVHVARIFKNVDAATVFGVKEKRVAARLDAISQAEQQVQALKEKAVKDSIAFAEERKVYEDAGGKPDSLFNDKLKTLAGDWVLTFKSKTDAITIFPDGSVTGKSNKVGVVALTAKDRMLLVFDNKRYKLYESKDGDWINKEDDARLERKSEKKK